MQPGTKKQAEVISAELVLHGTKIAGTTENAGSNKREKKNVYLRSVRRRPAASVGLILAPSPLTSAVIATISEEEKGAGICLGVNLIITSPTSR